MPKEAADQFVRLKPVQGQMLSVALGKATLREPKSAGARARHAILFRVAGRSSVSLAFDCTGMEVPLNSAVRMQGIVGANYSSYSSCDIVVPTEHDQLPHQERNWAVARVVQLSPGEEPPPGQRWVLVKVVDRAGGKTIHQGLNATFHTTISGLAFALAEASRHADENGIDAVYVQLRSS